MNGRRRNKGFTMRRSTIITLALTLLANSAIVSQLNASVIGPWPVDGTITWETQPIPSYSSGPVTISALPAPYGLLNMTTPTGSPKNATWLPIPGYAGERMAFSKLLFDTSLRLDTIHAKVYDPSTGTGQNGFSLVLWDNTGKILDFGIRPTLASNNIRTYQYDGAAWNNVTAWGRTRTGNNYYTYDISQNSNGTLSWTFGWNENGVTIGSTSGTTTVAYGVLNELWLDTCMVTTSGAVNYKWTEFSYTLVPEPSTGLTLACGLGLWMFISRLRRR
jgi:hypothetical protein